MQAIIDFLKAVLDFFVQYEWYHDLYRLLLVGYPLVWLAALLLAWALRYGMTRTAVERCAHIAWGVAFLCHLIWVGISLPDNLPSAYCGCAYSPGQDSAVEGTVEIIMAILRIAPYILMALFDLIIVISLLPMQKYLKGLPGLETSKSIRSAGAPARGNA